MRLALLMRLFSALPYPVYFPLVRAVTRGR
jgi:hypothetical protein